MKLNIPPQEDIAAAISAQQDWALNHLRQLVARPSLLGQEEAAQEYMAVMYEELGYDTKLLPIDADRLKKLKGYSPADWSYDRRPNVVGVHDVKNPEGKSLIFNGHVDVVSPEPVKLWSRGPFTPHVANDNGETWVYGRGAGDMKGGTICYLWALKALQDMGLEPASKVILQSPIEEECTGNGALALLADGYTADACIIPEPFDETVLCTQIGVIWFQVRVLGKTTHVLGAGRGVNAIEKSWPIIQALRELEKETNRPELVPAPYKGVANPINLNVGVIDGGDWASTVAGECVTRFRFGLFPGESLMELKARIEKCVAEAASADPWLKEFPPLVEYIGFQAEGCGFDEGGGFGKALQDAHRRWRGELPKKLHATCTTDVRHFNLYYDIPATCYGPKAENIHGVDERVSLDSMRRVAEVMTSFVIDWCGVALKK
ncbi:MAG: ArgE/DapE family deacylase [Alphaproteobacteria bacterium]|nr:MAG: ArgE/DapE family deacylase [Alphaproteobacteria bacterium]